MQSLESAAFAAWPSKHLGDLKGWHVRLDRGYTKRANSANATSQSQPLSDRDVDDIEARFRALRLTPTFRLPSFAQAEESDALLERRGYVACDLSWVMTRPLLEGDSREKNLCLEDAEQWLESFQLVSGNAGADHDAHLEILQRITHPCAWSVQPLEGSPQSCGLGVVVDGTLGLFDIATRADHRRRGHALDLCRGLLAWGYEKGARNAFLQVAAANKPAVDLYERIGFKVAYKYWYRVHAGNY